MTPTIRTATDDDRPGIERLVAHAFFDDLGRELDPDRITPGADRTLVAESGGQLVGHVMVWPLGHWLGGARVSTGGVGAMVVDPATRGRGVGKRLLAAALEAMAARGEALSTLFPLTRGIYRRLGWEVAGERPQWRLDVAALSRLPASDDVELRPGGPDDVAAMARLEAALAPRGHGMLARPERFARRTLEVGGDHAVYLALRDGDLCGYVVAAHAPGEEPGELFTLRVRELVAADGAAERALWRLLGAHESGARTVEVVGPPTPPLELELPERAVRPVPTSWRWMTRVVDAPGAVAARGWPADVEATVDLTLRDGHLPANDGRWRLEIADGRGRLRPSDEAGADLDVGAFAAWLTGWASPAMLAHAGRLRGADEQTLAALTRATAGPTPWIRDFF